MHRSAALLAAVMCASSANAQIPSVPGAELKLVAEGYKFTEGPAVDSEGNVYFTDQPNDRILKWSFDGGTVTDFILPCGRADGLYFDHSVRLLPCADDTLVQPNGITGQPDRKLLFVADTGAKKTYQYDIAKDGALTNRRLFCEMGSDSITRDSAGNLYLTDRGVTLFDRDGNKLGEIPINESWTANVCFGGRDMKMLFITAMDSLYSLEMSVPGTR